MIKYLGDKTKNIGIKKIMKKNQVVILALALMLMTAGYMNYTNNHENENMLLASLGDAQLVSANAVDGNTTNENELNNAQESTNEQNALNETTEANTNEVDPNAPMANETVESNSEVVDSNAPTQADGSENNNQVNTSQTQENMSQGQVNTSQSQQNTNGEAQEASTNASSNDYFTRSKLERETMYSQMIETYTNILENDKISSEQKDIAENEIKNINDTRNAIMVVENLFETKGFENAVVFVNSPSVNVVIKAKELTTEQVAQVQNIIQRELKTDIENIHITTN